MDVIGRRVGMFKKNVWLFGAGVLGEAYIERYGSSLCRGFIDNSVQKQGKQVRNLLVYSFAGFKDHFDKDKDVIYITMKNGRDEVILQLIENELHTYAKVFIPQWGIVDIKNSWDRIVNSQLGEDIGLMECFFCDWFRCDKDAFESYKGFYLDIGAYHPFIGNNTRWAYDLGWRGMNIEPNESNIKLFNIFRPEDININCGVSDRNEDLFYYSYEGSEACNSFVQNKEMKSYSQSTRTVKVRNINEILEEHHIENIDFMDIDAEGFDERIVYSFNWKKYRPKCVLIELLEQGGIESVLKTSIHKKMKEEGYIFKCFYTITALYVRADVCN